MKIALEILTIASCIGIIYQDLKTRLISVILFVLLAGALLTNYFLFSNEETNNSLLMVNILFVTTQILVLYFYFKIRKKGASFLESVFGLGDVIMLFCMSFIFPLPQLIVFLLATYFISFILLGLNYLRRKKYLTIPLAGNMGICYVLVFCLNLICSTPILTTFIA